MNRKIDDLKERISKLENELSEVKQELNYINEGNAIEDQATKAMQQEKRSDSKTNNSGSF
ncbi:hypothetical protein LC087_01230 [Bacillus carboniphilus]|uniref:Uncharacterized protein n=1 Tax=Bacillus carboniphilus TaxID=86663 RepID=A0ABY9JZ71_9BACI|nr:hypothetical protein [Bacillus carboniphilus]WLR42890.1 hypothetical protein LC087_01230 [Bacillus carboniphilus]